VQDQTQHGHTAPGHSWGPAAAATASLPAASAPAAGTAGTVTVLGRRVTEQPGKITASKAGAETSWEQRPPSLQDSGEGTGIRFGPWHGTADLKRRTAVTPAESHAACAHTAE